jgi:putative DNA primase/helicase
MTLHGPRRTSALEAALFHRDGRREGREIRFRCPAHDDAHPSARWNPDKEKWFCHACQTGGGRRDLERRLGLGDAPPPVRRLGAVAATYPYRDAAGALLYEVVRLTPKDFRVRRPAPGGAWLWNLSGVSRVPYRLPELASAVAAGAPVFLVEGEKDADALARLDLAATTSPGGAGKWRPDYALPLRGAHVVLVPDRDEPGRRHMEDAARTLAPLAKSLRLLTLPGLPEKGDVSDWLAAQPGRAAPELRAALLELARQAPPMSAAAAAHPALDAFPGLVCFADVEPQPVAFLWHPYLPLGKVTLLEGDPGQGKSWITAELAAAGSTGRAFPGGDPRAPFKSLLLTVEDGLADTIRPRLDALGADPAKAFAYALPLHFGEAADLATLDALLSILRPRLVVVDPIVAFLGASTDLYRANEVRSIMAPLAALAERHACALLAVRHLNKAKSGRSIYAGQGSIDFTAAARSVLLAGSAPDDPRQRALVHIKSNLAAPGPTCGFRLEAGAFSWTGPSRLTAADLLAAESRAEDLGAEDEACAFLREALRDGPRTAREITAGARDSGISEITLRRARRREGIEIGRRGFGPGGAWVWSLPADLHRCSSPPIDAHVQARSSMEPGRSSMEESPIAPPPGSGPAAPAEAAPETSKPEEEIV